MIATAPLPASRLAGRSLAPMLTLFACLLWALPLLAELPVPVLVEDFAPGSLPSGVAPKNLTAMGGRLYFAGETDADGSELWVSEGSMATTRRLADLCPGSCSSDPRHFTLLGGAVLFDGSDAEGRSVIYRLVADDVAEVVRLDYQIAGWAKLGSSIYFTTYSSELFRTDGTREGTQKVLAFEPEPFYFSIPELGVVTDSRGEALYFAHADHLFRLAEGGPPEQLFALAGEAGRFTTYQSGLFVFRGCLGSGFADCRAFVSDGTSAGTRPLENGAAELTADPAHFLLWQGRLYFENHTATAPYLSRIVSTDGTPAGTRLEIPAVSSSALLLAANAGHLFYSSEGKLYSLGASGIPQVLHTDQSGYDLVGQVGNLVYYNYGIPGGTNPPSPGESTFAVSQGEPGNTLNLLPGGAFAGNSAVLGTQLYFASAASGTTGLWRANGTLGGTLELDLGLHIPFSSNPKSYPLGSQLVAQANPNEGSAESNLYQVDPATLQSVQISAGPLRVVAAGAHKMLVADSEYADARNFILTGTTLDELPVTGFLGSAMASSDDHFFFFYDLPRQALWESDGSGAGTAALVEFSQGPACGPFCGTAGQLAVADQQVFFYHDQDRGEEKRFSVWDRLRSERRTLKEPVLFYPFPIALPGSRASFLQFLPGSNFDEELWISDGTAAGTQLFFRIPDGYSLGRQVVAGNRYFFVLSSEADQKESLWTSDFTTAGTTRILADVEVDFSNLFAVGNKIYFVADAGQGYELGFSDGSVAGTRFLDLDPGPEGSLPTEFAALADGRVAFAAVGDNAGYELWISNGTAGGTYRLTDLNPGAAASSPKNITQAGNRLFFSATDGITGHELWALDLPPRYAPCPENSSCVLGGRFEIQVTATTDEGTFTGRRAAGTEDSGVFTFFSADNWEMLVKVLDGCTYNQHYWVFAAAATDVAYTLKVTDRESGAEKVYSNMAGQPAPAITDTVAFSCQGES